LHGRALDTFLHAPPELKLREEALLHRADVVFTGGPSLYKRLQGRHSNVHCFPSSVDARHFAQAQKVIAEPYSSGFPGARCQLPKAE
jgi:hypothetical protein